MSFLQAEWRKLILANYEIDEKLLLNHLPNGTKIDKWNGITYVSLVGFMFKNTKLLGIKIPFHTDFEEVNLRFYVRYKHNQKWRRGVVFIKEIVPKMALSFVANTIYKENYETMPMTHQWIENSNERTVKYGWICKNEKQHIRTIAELNSKPILENSEEEFISEHYWGYTKVNDKTTFEYEVTHPKWEYYIVKNYDINVNFGLVYGNEFKGLTLDKPRSVMLMEGSKITVENKRTLR